MEKIEVFIQTEKITAADWQRLVEKVFEYEKRFTMEMVFANNTLEVYLFSQKDLSLLTTKLEGFLLKPVDKKESEKN